MDESNGFVLYFKADNLEDLSALMRGWYIRNHAQDTSYGNGSGVVFKQSITAFQIVREDSGDWVCIAVRDSSMERY